MTKSKKIKIVSKPERAMQMTGAIKVISKSERALSMARNIKPIRNHYLRSKRF